MFKFKKEKIDELVNIPQGSFKDIWYSLKRNKRALFGLFFIILLIFLAIFADLIAPFPMKEQNLANTLQRPNGTHLFGTDDLGRDVFSRIIYGTRTSLTIGVASIIIALLFGGLLGIVAGYFKGRVDTVIMRVCDVLLSIPSTLLAIAIVASLGNGINNLILAISIANIPIFARIIRSSVLSVNEKQFIEASNALGATNFRIIFRHVVPNVISPIIVQSTMGVATAILSAAGLGFIGLGVEPAVAEWGTMLNLGKSYIRTHQFLTFYPGIIIMLTILSFNMLGDGIRDAIDPRTREK
ncbi:ABC transporter permease [Haploplasma axanthum]|uniref:Oligopeptide transport system permease protein(OppB) n=1 Tax=Haploplasma axanthum TaxID=29552 RepID=A0A449BC91_HAPAX|nr:ABC transporter permease [Haploplasma axanthum]VEU80071.1 oligopeptide transport system permease protein(OppB) [Haploplasma axanthum]